MPQKERGEDADQQPVFRWSKKSGQKHQSNHEAAESDSAQRQPIAKLTRRDGGACQCQSDQGNQQTAQDQQQNMPQSCARAVGMLAFLEKPHGWKNQLFGLGLHQEMQDHRNADDQSTQSEDQAVGTNPCYPRARRL